MKTLELAGEAIESKLGIIIVQNSKQNVVQNAICSMLTILLEGILMSSTKSKPLVRKWQKLSCMLLFTVSLVYTDSPAIAGMGVTFVTLLKSGQT